MARAFSNLQTAQKSRGWFRFRRFFDEIDRFAPNFFSKLSRRRKNLRVAEKLTLRPNKPSPPIGRGTKQNDYPAVLINRPPGMITNGFSEYFPHEIFATARYFRRIPRFSPRPEIFASSQDFRRDPFFVPLFQFLRSLRRGRDPGRAVEPAAPRRRGAGPRRDERKNCEKLTKIERKVRKVLRVESMSKFR